MSRVCPKKPFPVVLFLACAAPIISAQTAKLFPPPDSMLTDIKHKEPKSGVQRGPGSTITIQTGVGTPTTINVLSFGKSGTLLAAGKDFGRVVVWDAVTRKFLCAIDTGQGSVTAVAISRDGQVIATAGEGDQFSLKLWHLPDGQLINSYRSSAGYIRSATVGPDGTWIVFSENFGATRVLELKTGKQLLELKGSFSPVLSPDATVLMVVTKTEFVLINTSAWTKQQAFPRDPVYAIPLALNPETDRFVLTSPSAFMLASLSTGKLLPNAQTEPLPKFNLSAGGFAAFDSEAPYLLFGHSDGRLWAWDSRSGHTCISPVLYSESGALSFNGGLLAGARDNSILAQGQSPDGILLWDTKHLAAKCGFDPVSNTIESAQPATH
jgi:WD40 repeat protein